MEIKEIEIEGEKVYLKKSILGWGIVHPIKENGKINWKNLISRGSWFKLIAVIIIVLIILGCINEFRIAVNLAKECINKTIEIVPYINPLK
jgi:hypothetical protein